VYKYRFDGLRYSKTVNGEATEFVWDSGNMILVLNSTNDVTEKYVYGINLIKSDIYGYYLYNGHGDVVGLTDSITGALTQEYKYDAVGNEEAQSEYVSDMAWDSQSKETYSATRNNAVISATGTSHLKIGGKLFAKGVGTRSDTTVTLKLNGKYARFQSLIGIDDKMAGQGQATFIVKGDGVELYSMTVTPGMLVSVDIDISGVQTLELTTQHGSACAYSDADWADAKLIKTNSTMPAVPGVMYGDVDGDGAINNKDLSLLRQYLANPSGVEVSAGADVNGDGVINDADLTLLRQYLAGNSVVLGPQPGTNPFMYCGEYFDKETGTYYLRNRYYSPSTGRFTQQDGWSYLKYDDPMSLNLYTYCSNNPLFYKDPTGHWQEGDQNLPQWAQDRINQYTSDYNNATTVEGRNQAHENANAIRRLATGGYTQGRIDATLAAMDYAFVTSDHDTYQEIRKFVLPYVTSSEDCTNFVSYCMSKGGIKMDDKWYSSMVISWSTGLNVLKYSTAWSTPKGFREYLEGIGTVENKVNSKSGISDLAKSGAIKPGDVATLWDSHTVMVTDVDTVNGIIYYSAHNESRLNMNMDFAYDNSPNAEQNGAYITFYSINYQ